MPIFKNSLAVTLLSGILLCPPVHAANLVVNDIDEAVNPDKFDTESDNRYVQRVFTVDPRKSALILIDVWASHPNDGWLARANRNIQEYLGPAVDAARRAGMTIIHAPTNQRINPRIGVLSGEFIIDSQNPIDDGAEVLTILRARGIKTVFYAGYATNACMVGKGASLMHVFFKAPDLQYVLLQDATIAFEMPDTLEHETTKKAFLIFAMMLGGSNVAMTTNDNFFAMLR